MDEIKVSSGIRMSISYWMIFTLICLFYFFIFSPMYDEVYLDLHAILIIILFFIIILLIEFLISVFANWSEIKNIHLLQQNRILQIKSPNKFLLILLPLFLLIYNYFFRSSFLKMSFALGFGMGLIVQALCFRIMLRSHESLLEIKIGKKQYFILGSQKFPYIGYAKISNGKINQYNFLSIAAISLLALLPLILLNKLLTTSPSFIFFMISIFGLMFSYNLLGYFDPFYLIINNPLDQYYYLSIETIVNQISIIYIIIIYIIIPFIILNYLKNKNFQWLSELIQNLLEIV